MLKGKKSSSYSMIPNLPDLRCYPTLEAEQATVRLLD